MSADELQKLYLRKQELVDRISAIRRDLGAGLEADTKEQAIQLENYEVLLELLRTAENELDDINEKVYQIEKRS